MAGWYKSSREEFLKEKTEVIAGELALKGVSDGLEIGEAQVTEWKESISLLRDALQSDHLKIIDNVVLEYDFKRRGLRMDTLLLSGSHALVIEFKRSKLGAGDKDQVVNYCVNLCEFHKVTQNSINNNGMVVPILVTRTDTKQGLIQTDLSKHYVDWKQIPMQTVICSGIDLQQALIGVIAQLEPTPHVPLKNWDESPFNPSSSIIDAALSLYGNHDVSAMKEHANEMETIKNCTNEIKTELESFREEQGKSLIILSGAPGSGKTLVGLDIAFSNEFKKDAVFLTGNAPLVEVLQASLKRSYRRMTGSKIKQLTGYSKKGVKFVEANTVFKIVKAHHFLKIKKDQELISSTDGDILIIDEAQRTYEKGRIVIDHKLEDHEANLIIEQMEKRSKPVIVLLIGHNQIINRGERGAIAWLEAAEKYNWTVSISNKTLELKEFENEKEKWQNHLLRKNLEFGHLEDSIRFYRNDSVEKWANFVLSDAPKDAKEEAFKLNKNDNHVWITRSLEIAKKWANNHRIGEEHSGIIASGKGGRLAAEGIFPTMKPKIAEWILAPMGDIRSSNMLETAQNQFQIQGLELDYTIVCWDADLRIEDSKWSCYNTSGGGWQNSNDPLDLIKRKNGYRVLLTRARKGMIIFVPQGDLSDPIQDPTRDPKFYDDIYNYLIKCGAQKKD